VSELDLSGCPICLARDSLLHHSTEMQAQTFTWYECRECASVLLWMGDDQWAYQKVGREDKADLLKQPMTSDELRTLLPEAKADIPASAVSKDVPEQVPKRAGDVCNGKGSPVYLGVCEPVCAGRVACCVSLLLGTRKREIMTRSLGLVLTIVFLAACGSTSTATPAGVAAQVAQAVAATLTAVAPIPVSTAMPSHTPTRTPEPTNTSDPTKTSQPTNGPTRTATPSDTPTRTATPSDTPVPVETPEASRQGASQALRLVAYHETKGMTIQDLLFKRTAMSDVFGWYVESCPSGICAAGEGYLVAFKYTVFDWSRLPIWYVSKDLKKVYRVNGHAKDLTPELPSAYAEALVDDIPAAAELFANEPKSAGILIP
jgi:hypothetical protein